MACPMRIAFILDVSHRSGLYNGTLMREGVGVSGTETNHILLAEIFAEYGHEVHYISSDVVPGQDRNVMYSQSPPKNNQFDLVFDTFLMSGLNHHVRTDHLILIMQCQTFVPWIHIPQDLYRLQRITGYKKLTFTTQSSWAKKSFHYYNPPLSIFPIHIIGNAPLCVQQQLRTWRETIQPDIRPPPYPIEDQDGMQLLYTGWTEITWKETTLL